MGGSRGGLPQYRGRGGRFSPNSRGGSSSQGRSRNPDEIGRHGARTLVNERISKVSQNKLAEEDSDLFKEFLNYKKTQAQSKSVDSKYEESSGPSYADIAKKEDDELAGYNSNSHKETIMFLEWSDLKWKDEPWFLMKRYLSVASFTAESYKPRNHYEEILKSMRSVEITHTMFPNKKEISFSKAVIKNFVTITEWGISPLMEKEYFHPESGNPIKFNYWDYIHAFEKAFLYENSKRKHSWFFKICSKCYEQDIPNWVFNWWKMFGPPVSFMPAIVNDYYVEWLDCSPKIVNNNDWIEGIASFWFLTEFSVPWIWKWYPSVGNDSQNIPCLQRNSCSKFWNKILQNDPETKLPYGQETLEEMLVKIQNYKNNKKLTEQGSSPFDRITQKLKNKGGVINREILIEEYISQMEKDLHEKMTEYGPDSYPMETSSRDEENQFSCLAGESQDPNEEAEISIESIETIFDNIRRGLKGKSKLGQSDGSSEDSFGKKMKGKNI